MTIFPVSNLWAEAKQGERENGHFFLGRVWYIREEANAFSGERKPGKYRSEIVGNWVGATMTCFLQGAGGAKSGKKLDSRPDKL